MFVSSRRSLNFAGFIDGWAVGRNCLSRQLSYIGREGAYEAVMFDRHEDMVVALIAGKVWRHNVLSVCFFYRE